MKGITGLLESLDKQKEKENHDFFFTNCQNLNMLRMHGWVGKPVSLKFVEIHKVSFIVLKWKKCEENPWFYFINIVQENGSNHIIC